MGPFGLWHWAVVLLVIVLVFAGRKGDGAKPAGMDARHPVFSSVTTRGDEAEHVDDRLPGNPSRVAWSLAVLVAVVLGTWWLTRT